MQWCRSWMSCLLNWSKTFTGLDSNCKELLYTHEGGVGSIGQEILDPKTIRVLVFYNWGYQELEWKQTDQAIKN